VAATATAAATAANVNSGGAVIDSDSGSTSGSLRVTQGAKPLPSLVSQFLTSKLSPGCADIGRVDVRCVEMH
jgi:hypothetical protein